MPVSKNLQVIFAPSPSFSPLLHSLDLYNVHLTRQFPLIQEIFTRVQVQIFVVRRTAKRIIVQSYGERVTKNSLSSERSYSCYKLSSEAERTRRQVRNSLSRSRHRRAFLNCGRVGSQIRRCSLCPLDTETRLAFTWNFKGRWKRTTSWSVSLG